MKIHIVGDAGSGRTALEQRLTGDAASTDVTISVESGQTRAVTVQNSSCRDIDVFFVTFDVTDKDTFENAKRWCYDIRQNAKERAKIVLVACNTGAEDRKVTEVGAREFASDADLKYFETDAQSGAGCTELLEATVRDFRETRKVGVSDGAHRSVPQSGGDTEPRKQEVGAKETFLNSLKKTLSEAKYKESRKPWYIRLIYFFIRSLKVSTHIQRAINAIREDRLPSDSTFKNIRKHTEYEHLPASILLKFQQMTAGPQTQSKVNYSIARTSAAHISALGPPSRHSDDAAQASSRAAHDSGTRVSASSSAPGAPSSSSPVSGIDEEGPPPPTSRGPGG